MTAIKKENCKLTFECKNDWLDLTDIDQWGVRHCSSCNTNVHWCNTQGDIDYAKQKGWCVAYIDLDDCDVTGSDQGDYFSRPTVGMLSAPPYYGDKEEKAILVRTWGWLKKLFVDN